jgi:hypothetical protein
MSHLSNIRKINEIDNLNTKKDFEDYIKLLNLNEDENIKVNTLLERTFMKKNNNPELIKDNKQRLRADLKEFVEAKKKEIGDKEKRIIKEEQYTEEKRQKAKKDIIDLNSRKIYTNNNNYDLLAQYPSKLNTAKQNLSENLTKRILPPISILKKEYTNDIFHSSKEFAYQQNKHEKMKEKEKKLKQRMEKLADKIGKLNTYRSIGKMKILKENHPFYDELMDIEKHIYDIEKKEERIKKLEDELEKMEKGSEEEQEIQQKIGELENEIKDLIKMIKELEEIIDKLEKKEYSPTTYAIMKRRETKRKTKQYSKRIRSSLSLSPHHENEILERYDRNRANNKKQSSSKKNSKSKDPWVYGDPIRKRGPFTYGGGKRTQKKSRKSRKL